MSRELGLSVCGNKDASQHGGELTGYRQVGTGEQQQVSLTSAVLTSAWEDVSCSHLGKTPEFWGNSLNH